MTPTDARADRPPASVLVRGLTYRYPDGRQALRGVDLEIRPGATVALLGPNGAGKSTLLLHLNGLLPGRRGSEEGREFGHGHDLPTFGRSRDAGQASIWIDGLPVDDRHAPEIRRRVGLLFQDPDDQLFSPSVIEDVAFGPLNLGKRKAEARRIALECLGRVDLADAADRPPHHLSFGERKRACLAGVLACEPTVLVLDEPTANLDPRSRRNFIALIRSLPATKLIATHDLEFVLELCDRVALLDEGRIVAEGPPEQVMGDEPLMEAHGLELPLSLRMGRAIG
ncbi:energy-coupling factor ABC transporter ATP-binding protein [Tautonia plasticadhaerens]|uniref:Energy-coupling factor transporter ATP-binding protein EcfA3 n=1 Tax=Tautonia plasticadhaerens TaxID=2527974 RepID=A0A518GXI6_9BACT|nr:ABC transporter ATP-binding protein [Tautonia plasticadhaerens]QDV33314.1 Energy-coupling factor transporter ATP-binding protein EcfA3 [Tautonia plasticadhaerens]